MVYILKLSLYGFNCFCCSRLVKINVYLLDFVILNAILKKEIEF